MKKFTVVTLSILLFGVFGASFAAAQASGSQKLPEAPTPKTQGPPPASAAPFKDQKQKASYALGMNVGSNLKRQSVDIDPDLFVQGMKDAMSGGKTLITEQDAVTALQQLQADVRAKTEEKKKLEAEQNKKEGDAFLAANKTKPGVVTLASGLQYKIVTAGTGPKPAVTDKVVCNYKGTLINGTEFDSSSKHGGPATFPVSGVIRGWTEALQLMPVGSKWQLFVPPDLAYGERGAGEDIGPNATLVFEVELLSVQPTQNLVPSTPPATPPK